MEPRLLPLASQEDFSLARWVVAPCNEVAYRWIVRSPREETAQMAYLYGSTQAGKTHLAHVFAELNQGSYVQTSRDFGLFSVREFVKNHFARAYVFDEIESAEPTWLFDLFNVLREQGAKVLWVSSWQPSWWESKLQDLSSRFKLLPLLKIDSPDEATARHVFAKMMSDCGTQMGKDDIRYLLTRIPRDMSSLRAWAHALDEMSSLRRKPITRSLIREMLEERVRE